MEIRGGQKYQLKTGEEAFVVSILPGFMMNKPGPVYMVQVGNEIRHISKEDFALASWEGLTVDEMGAKEMIEAVAIVAMNIPLDSAEALVAKYDHVEAIAPVLSPGVWMDVRGTINGHKELARAFLKFRRVLEKLKDGGM